MMFAREMSGLGRMRDGPVLVDEKRELQLLRNVNLDGKGLSAEDA